MPNAHTYAKQCIFCFIILTHVGLNTSGRLHSSKINIKACITSISGPPNGFETRTWSFNGRNWQMFIYSYTIVEQTTYNVFKQRPDQYKMKILVFSIQYDFRIMKYQYHYSFLSSELFNSKGRVIRIFQCVVTPLVTKLQ